LQKDGLSANKVVANGKIGFGITVDYDVSGNRNGIYNYKPI
jgi:hypothetical protein